MASRKKSSKRATDHADFAGPDAQKAAIETLSSAAAKKNGAGHNSGDVPDEVIQRHIALVEAAHIEWQQKRDEAASAQGVYRNRLKVAKGDGVNKDDLVEAFRVKATTSGEYVASRRNLGRYLRLMGAPVAEPKGGQGVFDFLDVAADGTGPTPMDAELQGDHAYRNGEDRENNPFQPNTDNFALWDQGWTAAETANAMRMAPNGGGTGDAAH